MTLIPSKFHWRWLRQAIFSCFIMLCFIVIVSVSASDDPPAPTAEQKKLISAVEEAVKAAEAEVQPAEEVRRTAANKAGQIATLSIFQGSDGLALQTLDDLTKVVDSVGNDQLLSSLTTHKTRLTEAKEKISKAQTKLPEGDNLAAEIVEARDSGTKTQERIAKQITAVEEINTKLKKSLDNVPGRIKNLVSNVAGRIGKIKAVPVDANEKMLRDTLPNQLAVLQQTDRARRGLRSRWTALSAALSKAGEVSDTTGDATANPVQTAIDSLDADVNAILNKLLTWFGTLKTTTSGMVQELTTYMNSLSQNGQAAPFDVVVTQREAADRVQKGYNLLSDLDPLFNAWASLSGQLQGADIPEPFDLQATNTGGLELQKEANRLKVQLTVVEDIVAGDYNQFTEANVSLYYFTDVPRLMQILNPATYEIGGIKGLREQAAEQRRKLTEAELSLADAQAEVSISQRRVEELQEELRQSRAEQGLKETLFKSVSSRLRNSQARKQQSDKDLEKAKAAADAAADDPVKKAALDRETSKNNRLAVDVEEAQRKNDDAQREKTAADERFNGLKDEQTGLPPKIQAAKDKLQAAQSEVIRQRKAAFLLAQDESNAFARARDNAPYWYAPAIGSSTDPAKRVKMYAYADSKTIFIRGKKDDVERVKKTISRLDSPSPQARLTLWTLELSGKVERHGKDDVFKALQIIEGELSATRAQSNAALSFLRDCIHKKVDEVAKSRLSADARDRITRGLATDSDTLDLYVNRFYFYDPEVRLKLGFSPENLRIPNPDPKKPILPKAELPLPDPSRTTTLGESLMVLSLAQRQYGKDIMKDFADNVKQVLINLKLPRPSYLRDGDKWPRIQESEKWFSSSRRALGLDDPVVPTAETHTLTAAQHEIVTAIKKLQEQRKEEKDQTDRGRQLALLEQLFEKAKAAKKNSEAMAQLEKEIKEKEEKESDLNLRFRQSERLIDSKKNSLQRNMRGRLSARAEQKLQGEIESLQEDQVKMDVEMKATALSKEQAGARLDTLKEKKIYSLAYITKTLREEFQVNIPSQEDNLDELAKAIQNKKAEILLNDIKIVNPLRTANARVAAADQMLKELIIAVEDDVDRHFVQPMIWSLREQVTRGTGVNVGVVQRTSVLATNRLVARVDPRGTAQLAVGEEQNLIQAVQQLTQLYFAAQTGGVLGVIKGLDALPQKSDQELYGINTGNTFQVTPIFDPSGQALRFKFDHVAQTQIREPQGTTNPQLPRIERHTVNTEVQVSNLELREVSRFEANSQLGLTTRRWGGIPLIKDLPKMQDVPLLGWFVRKKGQAAITQHSLIFAQTTMYPTIADIMDLLSESEGGTTQAATESKDNQ